MAKVTKRTPDQIEQLIAAYHHSGLTKQEFCERQHLRPTSLNYYLYRVQQLQRTTNSLVKVDLTESRPREADTFCLLLANNRRIEFNGNFSEQQLAKLIRAVEAA